MVSIASSSAAGSLLPRYDIFINHRGPDVKLKFVAHLADALRERNYKPFVDKYDLEKGGLAMEEIQAALEGASILLAVFTSGYAESIHCLNELVDMLECCKRDPEKVKFVPIFLDVKPQHLRWPCDGPFKEAFQKHESRAMRKDVKLECIQRWKKALWEAAGRTGFELSDEAGDENILKHKVLLQVGSILGSRTERMPPLSDYVVGHEITFRVAMRELEKIRDKVAVLGIWGMGGIGKTTLANELYDHYSEQYEFCIFLNSGRPKEENVMEKDKGWFQKVNERKVLLVIDDISIGDQSFKLVPNLRNLANGSCLILTSREQHVMKSVMRNAQASYLLEMDVLSPESSYKLFCYHAFGSRESPKKSNGLFPLAKKVVDCCGGLPLALEIIGKHLFEKDKMVWTEASEILKNRLGILDILSISYDALSEADKMMFLDVSCQMAGLLEEDAIDIWKSCEGYCWPPECLISRTVHDSLSVLKDKALVKVDSDNRLFMGHDLLRDMGRELAGKEHICGKWREPGKHSHLWNSCDAEHVLNTKKGTKEIRGLSLVGLKSNNLFDASKFDEMTEIHLLQLSRARIEGDFSNWSKNIRWLEWKWSPLTEVPPRLQFLYLKHLDLSHSWKLTRLWSDDYTQVPTLLKVLNLFHCYSLVKIPENIKFLKMLKRLNLGYCSNLKTLPSSLGWLTGLQDLDLTNCRKLESLPNGIVNLSSLKIFRMDWCYKVTTVPEDFGNLGVLVTFSAANSGLTRLPDSFSKLSLLEELSLKDCHGLSELPESIKGLVKLKVLCLRGTSLKTLPTKFGDLEHLLELDLQLCKLLESLPESFGRLKHLRVLNLGMCTSLRMLCSTFEHLKSLMNLDLTNCPIRDKDFPLNFGCLCFLSSLVMQGSHLTRLPRDFSNLTNLVHLYMGQSLALADIGSLPASLEVLDLHGCFRLKGVFIFEDLSKLTELNLGSCKGLTFVHGLEHKNWSITVLQASEEISVKHSFIVDINMPDEDDPSSQEVPSLGLGEHYAPVQRCVENTTKKALKRLYSERSIDLGDCVNSEDITPAQRPRLCSQVDYVRILILNDEEDEQLRSLLRRRLNHEEVEQLRSLSRHRLNHDDEQLLRSSLKKSQFMSTEENEFLRSILMRQWLYDEEKEGLRFLLDDEKFRFLCEERQFSQPCKIPRNWLEDEEKEKLRSLLARSLNDEDEELQSLLRRRLNDDEEEQLRTLLRVNDDQFN